MKDFKDFKAALENLSNRITPSIGYMLVMTIIIASILVSRKGEPAPYNPRPVIPVFIK